MSCEKRPDCLLPIRIAPLSLAAFLALVSSEDGFMVVSILKVLAAILLPPILARGGLTEKTVSLRGHRNRSHPATISFLAGPRRLGAAGRRRKEQCDGS
jgi:hypothetical protein